MKLAIMNAKGGTAKTTTAVNLSHALVMKKQKVLICDMDAQASASLSLGFKGEDLHPSMTEVLLEGYPAEKAIRKTQIEGLDILTASMGLSGFDLNFSSVKGRENQMKKVLDKISGYDLVIIDCPPTLGLLPVNALLAADSLLVPVTPHYLALEGLATLMNAINKMKTGMNCKATLMGIVLTQVDRRGNATAEIVDLIREHYGDQVFKTEVRVNTRVAEAPSFGKTIFQHDQKASGALAYQKLAGEVLRRIQNTVGKTNGKKG